ncbi:universal stress protein [Salinigranum marinum]|uniref:universal stress protein n=1 Tax=Salinigranum marinum TaxID=1515595 RepID=UPI002989AA49|nr:universal stress protein [Salinigranum marinum]
MYDRILVPTDGSDHAVRAAEHALYLADAFDATVHVISVVDVQEAAGPFSAGGVDQSFIARLEANAESTIDEIEAAGDGSAPIESTVRKGEPTAEILAYADDHDVDLVVMGTHGRRGLRRVIAGSVTERVVRTADVPVITVSANERSRVDGGYDELLVPTDGSEPATAAVAHGLAIAEHTGARVHAVNVVDVGALVAGPEYAPSAELGAHLEAAGEAATGDIAERARDRGLDVVTAVETGVPARALLAYADEHDIDVVTMGTRGRTGLSRYVLGSTAGRVIRDAEMPVLSLNVRGPGADESA